MQELQRKEATLETTKNENRRLQEEAQSQVGYMHTYINIEYIYYTSHTYIHTYVQP